MACRSSSSPPTTSAASRSGWPRRRPGCDRPGCVVGDARSVARPARRRRGPRRVARRVLPADAHRDAPGGAGDRSRSRHQSIRDAVRVRPVRAAVAKRCCASTASPRCSGRRPSDDLVDLVTGRGRSGPGRWRDVAEARIRRRRIDRRCCRSHATRRCRLPDGTRRIVGSTDATRGCKHRCRHCPIVPVYDGQFRVVPVDVVLADIEQQVAPGRRAHHVRRSGLLQRSDARAADRRSAARAPSARQLRRDDQGRTSAARAPAAPGAGADGMRVCDERG